MERTRDRYKGVNEIANDGWRAPDPGRQTRSGALVGQGQLGSTAEAGGEGHAGASAQREEDTFAIHLLGFSSTEDRELDALYQQGEAELAERDAEGVSAPEAGKDDEAEGERGSQEQAANENEAGNESESESESEHEGEELSATSSEATGETSDTERAKKSQTIPDLPGALVQKAHAHFQGGRRQRAIDTLLRGAKNRGRIEPRLLHRRRMRYAPNIGADGFAYFPGFKNGKALPTKVEIGPSTFDDGLGWLYSTMLHEYQHVLQYQARRDSPSKVPGQDASSKVRDKQQETEAYAREIILSRKSGIAGNSLLMERSWLGLQSYWQDLSAKGRNALRKVVDRAREIYKRAIKRNGADSSSSDVA